MASFLFVFDFDHTLVDLNLDLQPLNQLAPDLLASHIDDPKQRSAGWTALMNTVLHILHDRRISSAQILSTIESTNVHSATKSTLNTLFETPQVHCAIISDANSLYINTCLRANRIDPSLFDAGIYTNPAFIRDDKISVIPYATDGHACRSCPANLCKSAVLTQLQTRYPSNRIVYVGDGSNDYCPAKRVPVDGYVLPRKSFRLERLILKHGQVNAQVQAWASEQQLQSAVQQILQPN